MESLPEQWQQISNNQRKHYKKTLQKVDKKKVIPLLPDMHDRAFEKIDCLDCAACCKNYSPRFKPPDIKRISKHLKMKEADFMDTYLCRDEDGDFVVTSSPCPFLGVDNTCDIYEKRPSDCARFPYTNEDVLLNRPAITLKNSSFCPAVFQVLEQIRRAFP